MLKIKVGFMRIGLSSFDMERGRKIGDKSAGLLEALGAEVVDKKVLDFSGAKEAAETFRREGIDLLILQHETFSRGNFSPEILRELNVPLIMWAI